MIVSWSCLEGWAGFSPCATVCSTMPAGLCVVTALPPLSGRGPAQPVTSNASANPAHRNRARNSDAAGMGSEAERSDFEHPASNVKGLRTVERGLRTVDRGLRTVDRGLRTVDRGLRTVDRGLRTVDRGLRTVDRGLRAADSSLWTPDSRLFPVSGQLWTVDRGLRTSVFDSRPETPDPRLLFPAFGPRPSDFVCVFISPCIGGQTLSFGGQPRIFSGTRLSSGAAPVNGWRVCCKCRALFMWKMLRLRTGALRGYPPPKPRLAAARR